MILGQGIDLIEVSRIARQVNDDTRFKQKIFTPREIAYCESHKNKAQHYAARFAAKEAFFKALGTGAYREGLGFSDVEILRNPQGQPEIVLSGRTAEYLNGKGLFKIHVSLTHLTEYACALVIIESIQLQGE
jgi:holo-[acyl-carrier protein] synthase